MRFVETPLSGAWLITPDRISDDRGFFARSFCTKEFLAQGIVDTWVQCNISYNAKRGTLRGLHFAGPPSRESKLVRCTAGAVWDVIVDIRRGSPTFGRWFAADLTAENRHALYVPVGFAHGFQSLEDGSEVYYQMGDFYDPATSRGLRFDDPAIGIPWPLPCTALSAADLSHPCLHDLVACPS